MKKSEEWLKDYNEFLSCECTPPKKTSNQILKRIGKLINPNPYGVFSKVLGIHAITAIPHLFICHPFGLNPFNIKQSLADWFITEGNHHLCMILCGMMSITLSLLMAGLFLTTEEVRVFKKTEALHFITLGILTLSSFIFFGAKITLVFGGLWLFGIFIGGFTTTKIILKLKAA